MASVFRMGRCKMCSANGTDRTPTLTAIERRVLELSATGMTIAEVAESLDIDLDEVRRHLNGAMRALGAATKLEAVLIAFRRGLIDFPRA